MDEKPPKKKHLGCTHVVHVILYPGSSHDRRYSARILFTCPGSRNGSRFGHVDCARFATGDVRFFQARNQSSDIFSFSNSFAIGCVRFSPIFSWFTLGDVSLSPFQPVRGRSCELLRFFSIFFCWHRWIGCSCQRLELRKL